MFQQAEQKTYIEQRYSSEEAHCLFTPNNHIDRAQRLGDGLKRHLMVSVAKVSSCVRYIVRRAKAAITE
jgi:hypothetical protein